MLKNKKTITYFNCSKLKKGKKRSIEILNIYMFKTNIDRCFPIKSEVKWKRKYAHSTTKDGTTTKTYHRNALKCSA